MPFELWVDRRPDVLVYRRSVLGGEGRSREPEMATEKIVLGQGQDSIESNSHCSDTEEESEATSTKDNRGGERAHGDEVRQLRPRHPF